MKRVINTPEGPRTLPDWAQCYCVTRHTPTYINPLPFGLPNGDELWLCPNSYSQAMLLKSLYKKLNGRPELKVINKFSLFVQNLIALCWQQQLNKERDAEILRKKLNDPSRIKAARQRMLELVDDVRAHRD